MVVKKYLCAAPRPENWEEKAQALLRSFEGNVEKRDETLRQTLQQLKAIRYVPPSHFVSSLSLQDRYEYSTVVYFLNE